MLVGNKIFTYFFIFIFCFLGCLGFAFCEHTYAEDIKNSEVLPLEKEVAGSSEGQSTALTEKVSNLPSPDALLEHQSLPEKTESVPEVLPSQKVENSKAVIVPEIPDEKLVKTSEELNTQKKKDLAPRAPPEKNLKVVSDLPKPFAVVKKTQNIFRKDFRKEKLKLLDSYSHFRKVGDWAKVREVLSKILAKQLKAGMLSQQSVSAAIVLDAEDEISKGNTSEGFFLFKYAKEFSPEYPLPYFANAKALFLSGPLNFLSSVKEMFFGIVKKVRSFYGYVSLLMFSLFVTFLSLLFLFLLFSIIQVVKKHNLLFHDVCEYFPRVLELNIKKVLTVIIIALPFFTLSIIWVISYEIILFFRYMSAKEKVVSLAFFFLLALAPYMLNFGSKVLLLEGENEFWVVSKAFEKTWYPGVLKDIEGLEGKVEKTENGIKKLKNPVHRFLWALSAKKEGQFEPALKVWKGLLLENFEPYDVLVNMGNTYFAQKRFSMAADVYEKAIMHSNKPLLALYNISQAFSSSFMGDKALEAYTNASSIDMKSVEEYDRLSKVSGFNTAVVDANLPRKYLYNLAYNFTDGKSTAVIISRSLFRWIPVEGYWLFAIFGILVCSFCGILSKERIPQWCNKCGMVFCVKCSGSEIAGVCNECFVVFYKRSKNKLHYRINRMLKMKSHNKKKENLSYCVSLLFPGLGHVYEGNVFFGMGILFLFLLLVTGWFCRDLLFGVYILNLNISCFVWPFLLVLFAVVYIFVLRDIRTKSK